MVPSDLKYMKRALQLARRGIGKTTPNPMVGSVVVKDGEVIGEGYHRGPGQPHAEVEALARARGRAVGAFLYTTLEPCCHTAKRTPPCTDLIIQCGVKQVVSAMNDPNPSVSGKGVQALRRAGIQVVNGLLEEEAARLNEAYVKYVTTGKPFVTLKIAMTLDGRIATREGVSRWVTGPAARRDVHRFRSRSDAILTGIGTVMADDPQMTARGVGGKNPLRVVVDPTLKIRRDAAILTSLDKAPTLILTTSDAPATKRDYLQRQGVQVEEISSVKGIIPFAAILKKLGSLGVVHLWVEAGGGLNGVALRSGEVDKVFCYIAPILLCGDDAKSAVSGKAVETLAHALHLKDLKINKIGADMKIEGHCVAAPT